jgi:biopolymer transport protein TolQ
MPISQNINVLDLILHASLPVQLVMLLLVLGSISSWVIILMKKRVLDRAFEGADAFEERFWSGTDMSALMRELGNQDERASGLSAIFEAGFREFARLRQKKGMDNRTQLEGAQRAMRTALSREMDALEHNLEYLANVGSISPYVGLFGTVWGIMHSFRGLASMTTATLQAVAPGIAEALVATAIGLFAAIPAVIAYNRFAHDTDRVAVRFESFMEEFSNILQRQIK